MQSVQKYGFSLSNMQIYGVFVAVVVVRGCLSSLFCDDMQSTIYLALRQTFDKLEMYFEGRNKRLLNFKTSIMLFVFSLLCQAE